MLSIPLNGGLPLAVVPVNSISDAATSTRALNGLDAFIQAPSIEAPSIHQIFNDGVFTAGQSITTNQIALLICSSLVFAMPLAQSAYRLARVVRAVDLVRMIPGVGLLLPDPKRDVASALWDIHSTEKKHAYDRINTATGWWQDTGGAWLTRALLLVAIPLLGYDLSQARYRIASCSIMIAALGILTLLTLRNETRANKAYLNVTSPTFTKLSLFWKSAHQELKDFNQRIQETAAQRRQMMGIFNYQASPSNRRAHTSQLEGRRIA